ncbi:GNAT family N-acetyltransferase [Veronia nyctiphanis]|uniref:GNAT family N-acetyltransferase n=1 Tax=Veronia nyctiphanis TaxID=1278244 RepID=A0A4Q0YR34_9GAMM|nr:GNAT family N-acetyltransferase [Veronia nyctiphanis]RXJ71579.1 GNAT family N-acetyltransferase [Veronia nyctiphanis]
MKFTLQQLETERLFLRPLQPMDVDDLKEIYSDRDTIKYWGMHPIHERADISNIVKDATEAMASGTKLTLGVFECSSMKLVGLVLFFNLIDTSRRGEIGYALNRNYRRKGYMKEAMQSVIAYLFDEVGVRRIEADINPENKDSAKLLSSLNFEHEGTLKGRWEFDGKINDSQLYGLLNTNL